MTTQNKEVTTVSGADVDAIVVGAGFGGLYMTYKLRNELGLKIQSYDNGSDVGGTWYWNRYPGALSDTESFVYCFSFDKDLLQEWTWKNRYVTQPEILAYLNNFADRFELRKHYQFNTKVTKAVFNESTNLWEVETDKGDKVTAQYLITGLGLLSAANKPNFKGHDAFKGEQYHTSNWPRGGVDFTGKRVGVIGTGSTGVQTITAAAPSAKHLTVFQRSPQYSVPVANGPMPKEATDKIKANYDPIWNQVSESSLAFGFVESEVPAADLSEAETDKVFEAAWKNGGGFRFMFETFSDIATDIKANEAAASFIRRKISTIVKDPETAAMLTPHDIYAKRPLCDSGYYDTFNRDNVSLVDVKTNPITEVTSSGIRTDQGEYELDIIIYATGFDAVDGSYTRLDLRGTDGLQIKDKWADGPTSYLGMTCAGFPNMFTVLGPNGPFTNLPPSIETQVNWIADFISKMRKDKNAVMELSLTAENQWTATCSEIADMTLFPKAESWIFGANIPGKSNSVMFYLGGLSNYRQAINDEVASGYSSFTFN
ncbi:MAG: NAD(P)/FAD-dependent oxidoreductase [Pseudomonadales bacterium]|nr:NAD(P)/FAD-dependent oxidoreductase [Pseudomonadales bacterium]